MADVKHTPDVCWYSRRDELLPGMVFLCAEGGVVQLDQRTSGDGTKWDVLDWNAYTNNWSSEGGEVEPGDLIGEPIPDDADAIRAAITKATNGAARTTEGSV